MPVEFDFLVPPIWVFVKGPYVYDVSLVASSSGSHVRVFVPLAVITAPEDVAFTAPEDEAFTGPEDEAFTVPESEAFTAPECKVFRFTLPECEACTLMECRPKYEALTVPK